MQRAWGAAFAVVLLCAPAQEGIAAGLRAPRALQPASGATVAALPAFGWSAVAGADHYAFQIAADAGFASPVLGGGADQTTTRNTWATLKSAVPNGRYWWRVRGVAANGSISPWSAPRSVRKAWAVTPRALVPASGSTLTYPQDTTLRWTAIAGASRYVVTVAGDPALSSTLRAPETTYASAYTVAQALAPGKAYYWSVTPLDAAGHRGAASPVAWFRWQWPS